MDINIKPAKLRELQSAYVVDFLETWHDKARRIKQNNDRKQFDKPITGNNNNLLGTKLNNENDKRSTYGAVSRKKEDSIFRGI
jgi:hypothetical protein